MTIGIGSAIVAVSLPLLAAPAGAVSNPPWEPDPNATPGTLTFYNAAGTVVTGGSNLAHLFDYVAASTPDASAGTKATLEFANPTPATPTGNFPTALASSSTTFPNSSAPVPLNASPNPVVTLSSTDANLSDFIASHTVNTAAGYAHVYQVRVFTSGSDGVGTAPLGTYWDADVQVNPSTHSWVEIYPTGGTAAKTTTTTLSVNPAKSASQGATVTLTARVTAQDSTHPAGRVEFFQDGQSLGSNAVTGAGVTTHKTSSLLASKPNGTKLTATFTPSNTSSYGPSNSAHVAYTINPKAKRPKLSGPHQVGRAETCSEGRLDFGVKAKYSWKIGKKKVATGKKFVPKAKNAHKKLVCSVKVRAGSGPSSSAKSKPVKISPARKKHHK